MRKGLPLFAAGIILVTTLAAPVDAYSEEVGASTGTIGVSTDRLATDTVAYRVNTLSYNDAAAVCPDINNPSDPNTGTSKPCTLRKALENANADTTDKPVLITVDDTWANTVDPNRPWIMTSGTGMCTDTRCASGVDGDTSAFFWIDRQDVTVDLKGKIGVAAKSDSGGAAFTVTAKNANLTGFNGLSSAEASVVLMPGADGFKMSNGSTNQQSKTAYSTAATDNYFAERWLVINGKVSNVNISNWSIAGLYGDGNTFGAVIFKDATVDKLTLDNVTMSGAAPGSGCSVSSAQGCKMNGWRTYGSENTLSNVTITNSAFEGFTGDTGKSPFYFDTGTTTLNNWTFKGNTFQNNKGTTASIAHWPSTTINGLYIQEKNVFEDNTGYKTGLFDVSKATLNSIEISDNTFTGNKPGDSANVNGYGDLWSAAETTTNGFIFKENTLSKNGAAKTSEVAIIFESAKQVNNIDITDNNSTSETYGAGWLWMDPVTKAANLSITGNDWNELVVDGGQRKNADYPVLKLPDNLTMTGTNQISGNQVTMASGHTNTNHFIDWSANRGNDSLQPSNLTITDNTLNGFTGSAIQVKGEGITTIRDNTFTRPKDKSGNNTVKNEEEHSDKIEGFMVQNQSGSNGQIATVYPTAIRGKGVDTKWCALPVAVQANPSGTQPRYPITVDWYATQHDDAEIRMGSTQITSAPTGNGVQIDVDLSAVDGQKDISIRLQTIDNLDRSSQYSRTVAVGDVQCIPETWELTKTAYSDKNHTLKLDAGTIANSGDTVYWLYTVENKKRKPFTVKVEDDQKTDDPVCTVEVAAWDEYSCEWAQQMPTVSGP